MHASAPTRSCSPVRQVPRVPPSVRRVGRMRVQSSPVSITRLPARADRRVRLVNLRLDEPADPADTLAPWAKHFADPGPTRLPPRLARRLARSKRRAHRLERHHAVASCTQRVTTTPQRPWCAPITRTLISLTSTAVAGGFIDGLAVVAPRRKPRSAADSVINELGIKRRRPCRESRSHRDACARVRIAADVRTEQEVPRRPITRSLPGGRDDSEH